MDAIDHELYKKLGELTRYLDQTVRQVQDLGGPTQQTLKELPQACQHLSDLVRITEEGTHTVIEITERILDNNGRISTDLEGVAAVLKDARPEAAELGWISGMQRILQDDDQRLVEIMTKMSFQDLTSQRIKKIMTILDEVQRRLLEMVVVFGMKQDNVPSTNDGKAGDMLRQLDASNTTALKQETVNDILAEFGFN